MSACISSHGEYSRHEPNEDYTCTMCGAFDEAGAIAKIRQNETTLRTQIAAEIEEHMRRHDTAQIGFSAVGDAYAHAARIARGES